MKLLVLDGNSILNRAFYGIKLLDVYKRQEVIKGKIKELVRSSVCAGFGQRNQPKPRKNPLTEDRER